MKKGLFGRQTRHHSPLMSLRRSQPEMLSMMMTMAMISIM
jgi:hypothetical protein